MLHIFNIIKLRATLISSHLVFNSKEMFSHLTRSVHKTNAVVRAFLLLPFLLSYYTALGTVSQWIITIILTRHFYWYLTKIKSSIESRWLYTIAMKFEKRHTKDLHGLVLRELCNFFAKFDWQLSSDWKNLKVIWGLCCLDFRNSCLIWY